jgi:signal transduction histidine kinase
MRERIHLVHGELGIASAPGKGAQLSIHIPLQ